MVCGYGPGVMVVGTRPTDGHVFFLLCCTFGGLGGVGWGNNVLSTTFFT